MKGALYILWNKGTGRSFLIENSKADILSIAAYALGGKSGVGDIASLKIKLLPADILFHKQYLLSLLGCQHEEKVCPQPTSRWDFFEPSL